ncbi:MAG: DNA repair protein RecO [Bacteroidota bacterium]
MAKLIKTRGIIFRSTKYSETSIITDIYTEEKGLRTYIIGGVRTKRAKFSASLLQLMSLVDMVAYHRDDREMSRIKELKAAKVYQSIPFNVVKGAIGMFMIELARKVIREHEENTALFKFLFDSFAYLDDTHQAIANLHLSFILQLTAFLGFMPNGQYSQETPFFDMQEGMFCLEAPNHLHFLKEEMSQFLSQFLHCNREQCHEIILQRQQRQQLLAELLIFYRLHIENMTALNAHLILQEVLDS